MRLEVIAQSLGYKSHAAWRQHLKQSTPQNPLPLQASCHDDGAWKQNLVSGSERLQTNSSENRHASHFQENFQNPGAAFLTALLLHRSGDKKFVKSRLKEKTLQEQTQIFLQTDPRTVCLEGVDEQVKNKIQESGKVFWNTNNLPMAPLDLVVKTIKSILPSGHSCFATQVSTTTEYEDTKTMTQRKQAGIPIEKAMFLSDMNTKFEVHHHMKTDNEDLSYSFGAVFGDWEKWTPNQRLKHMLEHIAILTKDFGVPKTTIQTQLKQIVGLENYDITNILNSVQN